MKNQFDSEREKRITAALLEYNKKYQKATDSEYDFTPVREAEALIKSDWNAFFFAVIFDQQWPAEKAWAIPFELKKRLGHLDVYKISHLTDADLIKIFNSPTALHRYANKMALWTKSASIKLVSEYNSKAENIWADTKEAKVIIERLDSFDGIGQKKSTMATNFLANFFKIPIVGWENIDISVDIMIRRVFNRLGLVAQDASDCDIIKKAQTMRPSFPGELDYPCWDIGRYWCLPQNRLCYYNDGEKDENCPLVAECPSKVK